MHLSDYQNSVADTAVYTKTVAPSNHLIYAVLGMCGETGEFAEKIKKILRDHNGIVSDELRKELVLELGDVLWYLARVATDLGVDLEGVARMNLRKSRGALHGNGDHR